MQVLLWIAILTRPVSEYSGIWRSGSDSVDDYVSLESSKQGFGVPVVQREGQWFGSDVDWVVFSPYPLELNLSASDFLFDVVDYANEVFACSVGVID